MNQDSNNPSNQNFDSSIEDAQDQWNDNLTTSSPPLDASFHTTTMALSPTLSTTEYDMQIEQNVNLPLIETICISSGDDNDNSHGEQQQIADILFEPLPPPAAASTPLLTAATALNEAQQQQITSTLSEDWLPPAVSTPLLAASTTATVTDDNHRSQRERENELFQNIEDLVREFTNRTNHEYPYYRVIRWTVGEDPKLEYVLTVVINRPTVVLE